MYDPGLVGQLGYPTYQSCLQYARLLLGSDISMREGGSDTYMGDLIFDGGDVGLNIIINNLAVAK